MDEAPMGHYTTGAYRIVSWGSGGVSVFVARSGAPGRRWLRFLRAIGKPSEWHVRSCRTLGEATSP